MAAIAATGSTLVTAIQLDEKTRDELFKVVADLQTRTGRRVTFDEAIMSLIHQTRRTDEARTRFDSLFGTLRGDWKAWRELQSLRKSERRRLERIGRATE